jgi:hypothetical protein
LVAELTAQIPDQRRVEEAYRKAGEVSQADLRYEVRASPERPSPPQWGMTGESTVKRFTYLLNAMEQAAQAENPAEHGYAAKRKSVLDFVWLIGESLGDAMRRAGGARPGAADPALREAAAALVAKLDLVAPTFTSQAVFMQAHGMHYDGPNYALELEALRGALSGGAAESEP